MQLATEMLGECRALYSIARTTTARLEKYNGLHAPVLYHPPRLASRLVSGESGNYILSVGRIESVKRVDLVVRAMASVDAPLRLIVAGEGTQREAVERAAHEAGVADRVTFLGRASDDEVIKLYAGALAVIYPPYDEDFGYVTLEAFLARKPVVTCTDSGGPTEFVVDGVNGLICEPSPEALAAAINDLATNRQRARAFGDAGHSVASGITWDGVVEKLVG